MPTDLTAFGRAQAVLRSYGTRLVLWGALNLRKIGTNGAVDETAELLASSQPGFYLPAAAPAPFRYFNHPWEGSVRLKRSAQNILKGEPITSTVTTNGEWIFWNHDKMLDTLLGAQGFGTAGESFEVGVTAIPSPYNGLTLGPQTFTLLAGLLGERKMTDEELTVPIGSFLDQLDQPLATEVLTAEDYSRAPDTSIGQTIPLLLGTCHGVELILVDPFDQGGRYLIAGHPCQGGTFYRNGLAMATSEYTRAFADTDGRAYITLVAAVQNARITGDIQGITPMHLLAFSDSLIDLNLHILASVGIDITGLDASLLAAYRALYPYAMDLPILTETSARTVWDRLNAGIPSILDQRQDGSYTLRAWTTATGTPVLELDDTNILSHEITEMEMIGGTILTYAPNATILTGSDVAGILTENDPGRVALLAKNAESLTLRISGASATRPVHEYETRLINRADALALAQLRNTRFGRQRLQHRVTVGSVGVGVQGLGDVVQLTRPRLKLQVPRLLSVADIDGEWNTGGVNMAFLLIEEID